MKTILAPIDFSGVSDRIAQEAIRLAKLVRGRVLLLHVVPLPSAVRDVLPVVEGVGSAVTAARIKANGRLAVWRRELLKEYAKIDTLLLTGAPAGVIVGEAEKLAVPYIVMGSHGHTAVYDALVGSTTSGVLKKARCPVVIVSSIEPVVAVGEPHEAAAGVASH